MVTCARTRRDHSTFDHLWQYACLDHSYMYMGARACRQCQRARHFRQACALARMSLSFLRDKSEMFCPLASPNALITVYVRRQSFKCIEELHFGCTFARGTRATDPLAQLSLMCRSCCAARSNYRRDRAEEAVCVKELWFLRRCMRG